MVIAYFIYYNCYPALACGFISLMVYAFLLDSINKLIDGLVTSSKSADKKYFSISEESQNLMKKYLN